MISQNRLDWRVRSSASRDPFTASYAEEENDDRCCSYSPASGAVIGMLDTSPPGPSSPSSHSMPPSLIAALAHEGCGLAPLPPAAGPIGLNAFFSGLAAGDDMTGLVQSLRRTMLHRFVAARTGHHSNSRLSEGEEETASRRRESEVRPLLSANLAAVLLSTEHPLAAEEATYLYFSPSTHESIGSSLHSSDNSSSSGSTAGCARGKFPVRESRLRALLSDRAAVALARSLLKDRNDPTAALAVLASVDPTPRVSALRIECHGRLGHWREAAASLEAVPGHLWTEIDVALTVRAAYRASLDGRGEEEEGEEREAFTGNSALTAAGKDPLPLRVLREAARNGVAWSSPAAVNDALGLLAIDSGGRWAAAAQLLDEMLLPPQSSGTADGISPNGPTAATTTESQPVAATEPPADETDLTEEVTTMYPGVGGDCRPDGAPVLPPWEYGAVENHHPAAVGHGSANGANTTRFLRANAVTVYQACRALRARPDLAFHYATQLTERYGIRVGEDFRATEAYLRACVREGQWEAALATICGSHGDNSGSSSRRQQQHQQRRALSPDLFLSLVALLAEHKADGVSPAQLLSTLFSSPAALSTSSAIMGGCGNLSQHRRVSGAELSKHYNTSTVARAYNTMIQQAESVAEAEELYHDLRQSFRSSPDAATAITPVKREAGQPGTEKVSAAVDDPRLENESYERLTMLYAQAGDWQRALGCLNALLHHPQRTRLFVPTTTLHDAVQYALEQSSPSLPPPPPSSSSSSSHERHPARSASVVTGMSQHHYRHRHGTVVAAGGASFPPPSSGATAARMVQEKIAAMDRMTAERTSGHSAAASTTPTPQAPYSSDAATAATAAQGGSPWQLSVALFEEMCQREVATSTVAFQSVVKKCFAQGAPEEAQKLFRLMMRRGVRR